MQKSDYRLEIINIVVEGIANFVERAPKNEVPFKGDSVWWCWQDTVTSYSNLLHNI